MDSPPGNLSRKTYYQQRVLSRYGSSHLYIQPQECDNIAIHVLLQLQLRVKNQCSKRTGDNVVKVSGLWSAMTACYIKGPIKGIAVIHLWKWEISADLCSWETNFCSTIFANCNVYIGWAYIEVRTSCSYNIISQPIIVVYSTTKKQRRWKFPTKVCTIFMYISVSVTTLLEMLYTWVHANLHCNHRWKLETAVFVASLS